MVMWRFERQIVYIGSLRVKLILACQQYAKVSLALNEIGSSSFKFKQNLRACSTNGKRLLILYAKQPMENQRGPTPDEKS
jgi:hypothetical protein